VQPSYVAKYLFISFWHFLLFLTFVPGLSQPRRPRADPARGCVRDSVPVAKKSPPSVAASRRRRRKIGIAATIARGFLMDVTVGTDSQSVQKCWEKK
jgi:hypothetical protein